MTANPALDLPAQAEHAPRDLEADALKRADAPATAPSGTTPNMGVTARAEVIAKTFLDKTARIGVIGLGYVGLPLCCAAANSGFNVLGFDVDPAKPKAIAAGESYLNHIGDDAIAAVVKTGRMHATTDFSQLKEVDAILICVPTPLTQHREPDLSYIEDTARQIARHLRPGQIVVLESTTWPGTTTQIVKPILEGTGLRSQKDYYLAFSPEREDPGNPDFTTSRIPKVIGGDGPDALHIAHAMYSGFLDRTVLVSSTETAEAVKLTENIFRAVNIALVNELKAVYDAMGIDVWEVIEAAKTKPFGYMPFYPGPGLGGHCVPIDPFYLTWKAREFDLSTRFIELAGEINTAMPAYVIDRLARALDRHQGRGLTKSRLLILGMAYKKNINDIRESPSLKIMELLEARGAYVDFYDPYVDVIPSTREHPTYSGRKSIVWNADSLASYNAALILTDHDSVDYATIAAKVPLVVDTRNVCAKHGVTDGLVVKA